MWREPAVSGITSGFDSAPPKWLGNSRHGTSAMLRMKAPLFSEAIVVSLSGNQPASIEIDDRSRRKADGHEGQNLARDILTDADAADGQLGGGLGEHFAARLFRHGGADRRVDDPRRNRVDAHGRQLKRQRPSQRFQRSVGNADDRRVRPAPNAEIA